MHDQESEFTKMFLFCSIREYADVKHRSAPFGDIFLKDQFLQRLLKDVVNNPILEYYPSRTDPYDM